MPIREDYYYSKVTAKGQVTLPAQLRQLLGIEPGDLVEVRAGKNEDTLVIEVRRRDSLIEATAGIARPKFAYEPLEWHEVEAIVKEEVGRRIYEEPDR
ncbi:MAG: AbrB/MazE/SpoVT family DNA-binding domain-containing protein [Dehalococcoidia bacterium]|nr:AbrB/MazE/SpoVT family DNA-binding domain-containing protein [Dehalococcoidia bacterium]